MKQIGEQLKYPSARENVDSSLKGLMTLEGNLTTAGEVDTTCVL